MLLAGRGWLAAAAVTILLSWQALQAGSVALRGEFPPGAAPDEAVPVCGGVPFPKGQLRSAEDRAISGDPQCGAANTELGCAAIHLRVGSYPCGPGEYSLESIRPGSCLAALRGHNEIRGAMMIKYDCPKCGTKLETTPSMAGKEDQCPTCKQTCTVPERNWRRAVFVNSCVGGGFLLLAALLAVVLYFSLSGPRSVSDKNTQAHATTSPVAHVVPAIGDPVDVRAETFISPIGPDLLASGRSQTPREIAAKVSPSVVLLVMQDVNGQPLAMASGFVVQAVPVYFDEADVVFTRPPPIPTPPPTRMVMVIRRRGFVATNMHVVKGAARGYAKLVDQKTQYDVEGVAAFDPARDLVILAVDGLHGAPLTLGDSNGLAVGDTVYAVGNPRGLEGTFSAGILSSVRKVGDDSLLQITAPISPGSSGGPVVNDKGDVVGVAVGMFKDGQNLNFAIPSRYLSALLPSIKDPVALADATKRGSSGMEKSILDEMGGQSTDGVEGGSFLWDTFGSFSFSVKNRLRDPVRNVCVVVAFYDPNGSPIDFTVATIHETIPGGLAKRVKSHVDESVQRLGNWHLFSAKTPGRIEMRVLYFDIVNPDDPAR